MALQAEIPVVVSTSADVMAGTTVPFGQIFEGGKCSGNMPVSSILNILCGLSLSPILLNHPKVTFVSIGSFYALVIDSDFDFNKSITGLFIRNPFWHVLPISFCLYCSIYPGKLLF